MNVRKLAIDAIDKIMVNNGYSNIVVNETLKKFELSKEDKGLFTSLVYGTIQHLLTIEYYLEPFIMKKKPKHYIYYLLCVSVYELVYLHTEPYAVCNEMVGIARLKDMKVASFVNGVLRNFLRTKLRDIEEIKDNGDEIKYLSIKYSHPSWLVAFFLKDYDFQTVEKILIENNEEKKDAIRINTIKSNKEEVKEKLEGLGIGYTESDIAPDALIIDKPIINTEILIRGLAIMQDISSQMVGIITNPLPKSSILDLCSAPGGKASHLAALMNNTGKIFACDIYPQKIKLMTELFNRLGISCIKPQQIDARLVKNVVRSSCFDYCLGDVPCSGLGVISHKVDLKYHIEMNSINEIINLQKEILDATWNLVKVGGFYIYSTCTINKDENEYQIREFLKRHPRFEIVEEKQILPFENHTDGFYICKMRRTK